MQSVSGQILNLCGGKRIAGTGISELDSGFLLGNGMFPSSKGKEYVEWRVKIWDWVQDFVSEALFL